MSDCPPPSPVSLPTDVQAEAVPLILGGGDVLMAAETGSGKTGAFCVPILQTVWETLRDIEDPAGRNRNPSDPPTTDAAAAAAAAAPNWTMSAYDRTAALAVNAAGLRCQSRDTAAWHGARATSGLPCDGRSAYHYEATVTDEGLCRIGWSSEHANLVLGTDTFGYGFGGTGAKSNNKNFEPYGESFGLHDVIGCTLNWAGRHGAEMSFSKNGRDLGVAFALAPAVQAQTLYPAIVLKNAELELNFGATPFKYPPPAGVRACTEATAEGEWLANPKAAAGLAGSGADAYKAPALNAPQAIIVEPTRELAEQTAEQLRRFGAQLQPPVRLLLLVGGVNVREQMADLRRGVDICIATPGRLEDLIRGAHLSLKACRFFVLDEADALLAAGQAKLIDTLHAQMPQQTGAGRRLQMVVCSATLHAIEVRRLADRLMKFPVWIDLKGEDAVPETVHHVVVVVDPERDATWKNTAPRIRTDGVHDRDALNQHVATPEQLSQAVKWLKGDYLIRAIKEHRMEKAMLFCRTKLDCDNVERWLTERDALLTCACLHGDRSPADRKANLAKFKEGNLRFLICTDVAARGLDIRGLPFVVNVTMPDDKANYVHRIGRVGRADRMGLAISLVASVPEKVWYHGQWCKSHGKDCSNTQLTEQKGCCIWYNEQNVSERNGAVF